MPMQISHEDSLDAIRAIKRAINPADSYNTTAVVEVVKQGKVVLRCNDVNIYTCYEAGYMQYCVSIMWEDCGVDYASLGLRGSYNTNFNRMDFVNGSLVIHAESYDIDIYTRKQ